MDFTRFSCVAIDYCFYFFLVFVWYNWWWSLIDKWDFSLRCLVHIILDGIITFGFFMAREQISFLLLGDKIAKVKRDYKLSASDWYYTGQTIMIGSTFGWYNAATGVIYWRPISFCFNDYAEIIFTFYIYQILKDIGLSVIHRWMHESKWAYQFHKEHHTVNKNAQNVMAYHIDFLDLFAENLVSPLAYTALCTAIGVNPVSHFSTVAFSAFMDIQIHSVNPYSITFINPILDYFLMSNVSHQIHHSCQTENYMFIPYHHFIPGARQKECEKYDRIMGTSFFTDPQSAKKTS